MKESLLVRLLVFGTLPTSAMLSGDFSQSGTTIYDPNSGNPDGAGKNTFNGNKIRPNQISSIVEKLPPLVPAPGTAPARALARSQVPAPAPSSAGRPGKLCGLRAL